MSSHPNGHTMRSRSAVKGSQGGTAPASGSVPHGTTCHFLAAAAPALHKLPQRAALRLLRTHHRALCAAPHAPGHGAAGAAAAARLRHCDRGRRDDQPVLRDHRQVGGGSVDKQGLLVSPISESVGRFVTGAFASAAVQGPAWCVCYAGMRLRCSAALFCCASVLTFLGDGLAS